MYHLSTVSSEDIRVVQVVVVLSGSMEPAFYRGDILFLNMGRKPFRAGEVVVFNINGRDIPIVHRIIKVHEKETEVKKNDDVLILTKVCAAEDCLAVASCTLHIVSSGKARIVWHSESTWDYMRSKQRTCVKDDRACHCRVTTIGGMTGHCTTQGRSGFIGTI